MTSGGGLTTLETAVRFPIRLVESGPAGGVILSTWIAERGIDRILSFDMGGTTAKICIIDDGKPMASRSFEVDRRYRFMKGSGLPVHPRDRDGRDRRRRRLAGERRRHETHHRRTGKRRFRSRPSLLSAGRRPRR